MGSKKNFLYFSLCIIANLFYNSWSNAGENLENGEKTHRRVREYTVTASSYKGTSLSKTERPPTKHILIPPHELRARDLYKILQKRSIKLHGLLAKLIKEKNTSMLNISKESNISAIHRHGIAQLTHKNPLADIKKNKPLRIEEIYDLYQGEDLIEGAWLEICFTWPEKGAATK